jgi:hypothetical protein
VNACELGLAHPEVCAVVTKPQPRARFIDHPRRSALRAFGSGDPPQQPREPRVASKRFQVTIAAKVLEMPIPELERTLESGKRRVEHAQDGVTAREVIPGYRAIGKETDDPAIDLEGTRVLPRRREIIRVHAEGINMQWVAFQDLAQELELELDLALFAATAARKV